MIKPLTTILLFTFSFSSLATTKEAARAMSEHNTQMAPAHEYNMKHHSKHHEERPHCEHDKKDKPTHPKHNHKGEGCNCDCDCEHKPKHKKLKKHEPQLSPEHECEHKKHHQPTKP